MNIENSSSGSQDAGILFLTDIPDPSYITSFLDVVFNVYSDLPPCFSYLWSLHPDAWTHRSRAMQGAIAERF